MAFNGDRAVTSGGDSGGNSGGHRGVASGGHQGGTSGEGQRWDFWRKGSLRGHEPWKIPHAVW